MSRKVIKYIIFALCLFVGIILLDTLQALIFNNNPIIGTETKCGKKDGVFVSTYHCGDKNFTKIKSNTCSYEDVCGSYIEEVIQDNFEKMLKVNSTSSSTYDYIDNEYYHKIVSLGSDAAPILEKMYKEGKFSKNGLDANIVVILLQEISGCNIKDKYNVYYSTPEEFFILWKKYNCNSDMGLKVIKSENSSKEKYNLYLERDNAKIYFSNKINEVIYNNVSLKVYVTSSYQTLDDSFKKITGLLKNTVTLKDGGTKIYKSDKYDITIVKCNTLSGNKDVFIGDYEMDFDNKMCKR